MLLILVLSSGLSLSSWNAKANKLEIIATKTKLISAKIHRMSGDAMQNNRIINVAEISSQAAELDAQIEKAKSVFKKMK